MVYIATLHTRNGQCPTVLAHCPNLHKEMGIVQLYLHEMDIVLLYLHEMDIVSLSTRNIY